jgi:hypothetical protein
MATRKGAARPLTLEDMRSFMNDALRAQEERIDARMGARFEEMERRFDEKFAAIDRRFEAVDERFEAMDERFDAVEWSLADLKGKFEDVARTHSRELKKLQASR